MKKRAFIALLCVIVFGLCIFYFVTRDERKPNKDQQTNTAQTQIVAVI